MEDENPGDFVKPRGWGSRHTFALIGFAGMGIIYAQRFNLSIAIVAMVISPQEISLALNVTSEDVTGFLSLNNVSEIATGACPHLKPAVSTASTATLMNTGEFEWSGAEKGLILGCFFWGYAATQLPGGILATKYGSKWVLAFGMLLSSVFGILTPPFARIHRNMLVLARVIQGAGQGVMIPAMYASLAKWAPAEERSTLTSAVFAGMQFGTAAIMLSAGYMIDANLMGGWPSVFYIFGFIGLLWIFLWCFFVSESPEAHPSISDVERNYIQRSIGVTSADSNKPVKTPWTDIITSKPVWAILVGQAGFAWGLYTLLSQIPTYMKTIMHFDMKQNSLMSATPYIVMWLTCIITCRIADSFISRRILSKLMVRKLSQAISQIGPAVMLIAASVTGCDRVATVVLITVGIGISGMTYAGFVPNLADIAPLQAGVLMGISNTIANIIGFLAPFVASWLTDGEPTLQKWQYVFFLAAAIYVFDAFIFCLFASAHPQPWNDPDSNAKNDISQLHPLKPSKKKHHLEQDSADEKGKAV